MPQNTKDSKGGKSHPTKETGVNSGVKGDKKSDKNAAVNSASPKEGSITGAHNKGKRKTTP